VSEGSDDRSVGAWTIDDINSSWRNLSIKLGRYEPGQCVHVFNTPLVETNL
jgi:hypothetical protein